MPEFPAFCNTCGTVFGSGMVFDNCRRLSLSGNTAGPCPKCGGMGSIPDGVYDTTETAIRIISSSTKTKQSLIKLSSILSAAQRDNLTREQVTNKIQQDVPELNSLGSVLPQTRNELYAFIGIILTVIALLTAFYGSNANTDIGEADIQNMIDESIEKSIFQTIQKPSKSIPSQIKTDKKQGRNNPCACGSGLKYKKCCYLRG